MIYIQAPCGEKLIAPIKIALFDSFSRIHLVINRLQLVEDQKVSINVGPVI